ncbi:leucine-rich repeat domain-containing protein [Alistipes sp. An116]|uniref:leucine-rich repeat domain-containing protein n=1 Tax=Alistipes sp. An116 TaxID=1965546 RepID=UPI00194E8381|nr:leucine-rich repeat domain-containing protein [Alistipes sp. An116]
MKKLLFIVAAMFAAVSFSSCDKDDDNKDDDNGGGSDFARPALPDPNDVCSCMDDLVFMKYCYENFDVNKDGKVSKTEANAVTKIDLGDNDYQDAYDVKTLTGICYFPNLEIIDCYRCKRLTSVDLSHNLKITEIQDQAFAACSDLKSIILPNSVTWIRENAFYNCSSLTDITIPNSVTRIKNLAFYGCSKLKEIYCTPTNPPTLDGTAFSSIADNFILYVPSASVNNYKTADVWKRYADQIVGYDF